MTLENYVKLEPDREKVLNIKFNSFRLESRAIIDPKTKTQKTVNTAVMDVIEEDGKAVTKTFSTISDKLATTLQAAHVNGDLYRGRVGITMRGVGFVREYSIRFF